MNYISIFENNFKAIYPELYFVIALTIILLHGITCNPSAYYKYPILTSVIGWLSIQTLIITMTLAINSWEPNYYGSMTIIQNSWDILAEIGGNEPKVEILVFNNALIIDDFTTLIKMVVLLSALASTTISLEYIKKQKINAFEYIVLIMFSTLSMLFIVSSYDLISMYLAIELQSLCFYVLAAFKRNNEFSTEAGLKYFILGALSSGLLLFGESIIYGFTGITNFEELAKFNLWIPIDSNQIATIYAESHGYAYISIGLLFILVAFLFKIAAVPFHMWTPDVYEGAPTSVTAFFAITPKIAILALLLRLCLDTFWDLIQSWQTIILLCSLLSMFVGTLGALNQNKIKRLFAYSSIAHVGYLLIGLSTGTIEAIESLLLYIIIYVLATVGAFGILLTISSTRRNNVNRCGSLWIPVHSNSTNSNCSTQEINKEISLYGPNVDKNSVHIENLILKKSYPLWNVYMSNNFHSPFFPILRKENLFSRRTTYSTTYAKYITDLSTLSRSNPLLAATAAIVFFSNAGIPPLAGFYGKLNVFLSAIEGSMYILAISGILCSVMGAFYSIRLIKIMYFHSMGSKVWTPYKQISKESSILLALTVFFTLFFFLYPSFLFTLTHSAALTLCI